MRRAITGLIGLMCIGAIAAYVLGSGGAGVSVHISGDLARDIRGAVLSLEPEIAVAQRMGDATVEVVAVTDWDKLSFVPGAVAICGPTCVETAAAPGLVRVLRIMPGAPRKYVFLHIGPFLSTEAADAGTFALSRTGQDCVGAILAQELRDFRGRVPAPECALRGDAVTVWRIWPG